MTSTSDLVSRLATGLVLVALGGLFLAHNLNLVDVGPLGRFWPVLLIILGIARMVSRPCSGAWLLAVGVVMLLHTLDVLRLHESWPLFIVAAGLAILVRGVAPGWCGCDRHRLAEK